MSKGKIQILVSTATRIDVRIGTSRTGPTGHYCNELVVPPATVDIEGCSGSCLQLQLGASPPATMRPTRPCISLIPRTRISARRLINGGNPGLIIFSQN